ncbi:MAG: hypothetical protein EPO21_01890 [Chloroflexota bacterium]|nr:MAG: hypothetical protein EPO21_01890 [Chloroflexota bacterium]
MTVEQSTKIAPPLPRHSRRTIAIGTFLLLLVATGLITYIAFGYMLTRKPIAALLPLPRISALQQTTPPIYAGVISKLAGPMSIAVSPDGERVYVAESDGERVVKVFNPSGNLLQTLSPPNTSAGQRKPMYIAVDKNGRVFVSDRQRPAVHMYDDKGAWIGVYQPEEAEKDWSPLGLNVQSDGSLIVTNVEGNAHSVLVFARNERLIRRITHPLTGDKLSFPNGAVQDSLGRTYVSDSNNGRLLTFDSTGAVVGQIESTDAKAGLAMPRGVALDDDGRLYVADASSDLVRVFQTGEKLEYLYSFGSTGVDSGQFRFPNGVTVDSKGRIWVADWGNNRVQMWRY